jgi:hypothetical protein
MSQSTISPELAQKIQDYQQSIPNVGKQPDGPGKRVGKVGEYTAFFPLKPGKAEKIRQNLATYQAQGSYFEAAIGTVHDLRIVLFDNDTRLLFAATYDGDFMPYVADVVAKAGPWLDEMFLDVLDGYPGANDPSFLEFANKYHIDADIWVATNPEMTVKDIAKAGKMMNAFETLLDAASS